MTARITVSHFGGRQSHPLVEALSEIGMLDEFLTGFYLPKSSARLVSKIVPRLKNYVLETSAKHTRIPSLSYITYKIAGPLIPTTMQGPAMWHCLASFDRAVAKRLRSIGGDVFVGYEYSSAESFCEARRLGYSTVLEASSVHYSYQMEAMRGTPSWNTQEETIPRKQREIELADQIVVLSAFAKETYVRAGVGAERIVTIAPFVAPLPAYSASRSPREKGELRFVFAGDLGEHKGTDLLLKAFDSLPVTHKRLRFVGGRFTGIVTPPNVEVLPRASRNELSGHFAWADYLVLPSRFDGYGFVVAEALMAGVPVIVSDAVGAAELVVPGQNGWIFKAGDVDSLRAAMAEAASCQSDWDVLSRNAASNSTSVSRQQYVDRVRAVYGGLGNRRGSK